MVTFCVKIMHETATRQILRTVFVWLKNEMNHLKISGKFEVELNSRSL